MNRGTILATVAIATLTLAACYDAEGPREERFEAQREVFGERFETAGGEPTVVPTAPPPNPDTEEFDVRTAVELSEWSVEVSPDGVSSGAVRFDVENVGAAAHELAIYRTDLDPTGLPTGASGVDEGSVELVGRIDGFAGGESQSAVYDLEPGNYVLVCNIIGHYQLGMSTGFAVN